MAPLFVSLNKTAPWSPCSALYITEFFDNGHGRKYSKLSLQHIKNHTPTRGHLTQHPALVKANSGMNKIYCYSSHTLIMAFLLKHVTPLKL